MKAKQITEKSVPTSKVSPKTTPVRPKETPSKEAVVIKKQKETIPSNKRETKVLTPVRQKEVTFQEQDKGVVGLNEVQIEYQKLKRKVVTAKKPDLKKSTKPSNQTLKILKKIIQLQTKVDDLIPKAPFVRLCREIAMDVGLINNVRFTKSSLEAIQCATEAYLVKLFQDVELCATHRTSSVIKTKDMAIARKLRGEILA